MARGIHRDRGAGVEGVQYLALRQTIGPFFVAGGTVHGESNYLYFHGRTALVILIFLQCAFRDIHISSENLRFRSPLAKIGVRVARIRQIHDDGDICIALLRHRLNRR